MSNIAPTYERFYRDYGVRTSGLLVNPPTAPLSELILPRNSAYHWFGYTHSEQVGLAQDDPIAKGVKRYIFATNIEKYQQEDIIGDPRDLPLITTTMTRRYFAENKKIRKLKGGIEFINDEHCLVAYNYGLLNDHYRYTGVTKELDRWLNYHRTVYKNIARETAKSRRQHFLEFHVPEMVPPLSLLELTENGIDKNIARRIPDPDNWALVELYNLLTVDYNAYIFKDIVQDLAALDKINLIVICGDVFTVMNLGKLMSFAGDGEDLTSGRSRLAKRFLKSMLSMREHMSIGLNNNNTTAVKAITEVGKFGSVNDDDEDTLAENNTKDGKFSTTIDNKDPDEEDGEWEDIEHETVSSLDPFASLRDKETKDKETKKGKAAVAKDIEMVVEEDDDDIIDKAIDEELSQLEEREERMFADIDEATIAYQAYIPELDKKLEDEVVKHAQKYADIGLMTPAEVNRVKKIAAKVNDIPSPTKKGESLVKSSKIKPEDLVVGSGATLVNDKIIGVTDDSMKHSSLTVFDNQYITDTMQKDVANMVLAIQAAGIAVLDYKMERVANIKDEYWIYKVKVQPVGGSASTLTFRMPVVEEDGTYMASGSRYRTRKQRGDLPIRKVGPDEVALTSYYSKMFVNRTPRKQYNYSTWLVNTIIAASLSDDKNNTISKVMLNDVSDPTKVVPRAYSAIAMRVSSFISGEYTFYFDVNHIEQTFGEKWDGKIPIPVGKDKAGKTLYLDNNDNVLTAKSSGKTLGTISELIGLDNSKRPVDFAETKIFSKSIPLGIILAYQLGFGKLLKTLKCKVKKMGRRQSYKMANDEWALYFKSHKLIFTEKDKVATLLLKGFARVDAVTRKHELHAYDKQLNYNALFDNLKVPVRYLKEIPLMFELWIDPITKDILEAMKEPTDMVLLLMRATELLLNDSHPKSTDVKYMRDKGYERHAGLLYGELIRSIRTYNNKPLSSTNKVEMHPEVVWYGITKDPAHMILKEANPIHELKEQESVIYGGTGGRSTVSMTAKDRTFHENSLGSTSEATVDNGDTGTVIYTTFNPNYTNVRGMTEKVNIKGDVEPGRLVSTSMLLAPGAENEDEYIA